MRKIYLAISPLEFDSLVNGGELVTPVRPTSGLVTERRITEVFDIHITLDAKVMARISLSNLRVTQTP